MECKRSDLGGLYDLRHSLAIAILLGLFLVASAFAQFTGQSGVYFLGSANVPISVTDFGNPNISGVVVRFNWDDLEVSPGNFDWAFIDGEISKAAQHGKKVSLQPLGTPHWLDSIGARQYHYLEKNSMSPSFGKVVSKTLPWDSIYLARYKALLQNLAVKYAANPIVTYVNAIGGAISRGLPDTVITDTVMMTKQPFWTAFLYDADTLGKLMNQVTDVYMALFPSTPLWCSMDYVSFETSASGRPRNYLASLVANYGVTSYPDRFGVWREDIAACNPPLPINVGNQWYVLQQNRCRSGAQMLWNVQDGPARMNQCGVAPNTKSFVLDSAVKKAISLGMDYLEIYGADIVDPSLSNSISQANTDLINQGALCNTAAASGNRVSHLEFANLVLEIFRPNGAFEKELPGTEHLQLDAEELPHGFYFIRVKDHPLTTRLVVNP